MSNHALLVFGLLIGLALTVGVGVDAHNRGRSGFLWGLLTFFTGVIGAFVYALIVLTGDGTEDVPESVRVCQDCGTSHEGTPDYCSDCGAALAPDDDASRATVLRSGDRWYCSDCKGRVESDADRCPNCGAVF